MRERMDLKDFTFSRHLSQAESPEAAPSCTPLKSLSVISPISFYLITPCVSLRGRALALTEKFVTLITGGIRCAIGQG